MKHKDIDPKDVKLVAHILSTTEAIAEEALRLCFNDVHISCQYISQSMPNHIGSKEIYERYRDKSKDEK